MGVPSSFSSLEESSFSCQEPVMRLKTETLVDANSSAVVLKDIEDHKRELLFEQRGNQRCGNGCRISLSTRFWCCQDVSQDGESIPRDERVCSPSGDDPFAFIGAKIQALWEEVSRKSALRLVHI